LPGGHLIPPYLEQLNQRMGAAASVAVAGMEDVTISYAVGRCDMAANRDYWDDKYNGYAVAANPDVKADDTVVVARLVNRLGQTVGTIVNYACHTTSLAWENTLPSSD